MKKTKVHNDRSIFDEQIRLLKEDPEIQKMASFTMHNGNTTLQHVENVADVKKRWPGAPCSTIIISILSRRRR